MQAKNAREFRLDSSIQTFPCLGPAKNENDFTLIELSVINAIIVILAALFLPALSRARAKGQESYCVNNNNKQILLAGTMYATDSEDKNVVIFVRPPFSKDFHTW